MKKIIKKRKISEIANLYNTFFFDLYGVTHNGVKLFPDIVNILKKHSFGSIEERTSILEKGIGEHGFYQDFVIQHFLNKIQC